MPPQVISLLSSSPSEPSPNLLKSPPAVSSTRAHLPRPSRALDYDTFDLTTETSRGIATASTSQIGSYTAYQTAYQTVAGTKRTTSTRFQLDDDFLFLSDDDDHSARVAHGPPSTKIPRLSPGLMCTRKGKGKDSSKTDTHKPLAPSGAPRRNLPADPIENTSSPDDRSLTRHHKNVDDDIHSDPFASPPKRQPIHLTSPKHARNILFDSPPSKRNSQSGSSTWNWPKDLSKLPSHSAAGRNPKDKESAKPSTFIDLSSDPFDTSPVKAQPKTSKKNAAWDPISSSMPEIGSDDGGMLHARSPPPNRKQRARVIDVDDLAGSESEDLPDLDEIDFSKIGSKKRFYSLSPRPVSKSAKSHVSKPAKSAEEREQERKAKAQAREVEKERKRVEKEHAKEQRIITKEREKALAEVNRVRTDKKVSTPEMIVDLPNGLNPGVKVQIEALLSDLDVQHGTWHSRVENVVKWRRKVTSTFNEELGHWVPSPMRIQDEKHVMVIIQAPEFVKLALGLDGQDLEAHVLKMKTNFPDATIVYLIEGLTPWMRKNRTTLNRQFASAVRSLDPNENTVPTSSQPRRRNNVQTQEYIDEDSIEDALLSLQVLHAALIHHTNAPVETAQWVAIFTQHISTIPYRKARDATSDAGFCMESGQVRTGDGAKDTYVRMLQEITRVTAPIAYGIAAKYGTVTELVRGLEREGPLALENCRKSANRDGAFTDRMIGQAVSKRIHKIFTSRDPASTDV
ncbi:ERCC4 domain-containing protein [Biscogniauxia mediterranea]|nr:ERCC4 domain-containing protein [Biscogniauxia mediterranea]